MAKDQLLVGHGGELPVVTHGLAHFGDADLVFLVGQKGVAIIASDQVANVFELEHRLGWTSCYNGRGDGDNWRWRAKQVGDGQR